MFFFKKPIPKIVVKKDDNLLMVYCVVKNSYKARIQCVVFDDNSVLIGDILHTSKKDFHKGYGTLMMIELLKYVKQIECKYIYGNLSDVDYGHKDKLRHFYEKFGFTVTEFEENIKSNYGKIEKSLI